MRLLRHLSFSNVIAMLALFLALGGAAYAGTKINGNSINNGSIGGGKLKNETITANKIKKGTITGTQIAPGSITSSSIDVSTLGMVPSAQSANTAGTATKADSAGTADSAKSAERAKTADTASSAATANEARHAETADRASQADSADTASRADVAGEAETLNGETAEELTLSCQGDTEFYGGMCWDKSTRPARLWLGAVKECGDAGGRLPTIEELIAFVLQDGEQVEEQTWSGDIDQLEGTGKKEVIFTTDENGRTTADGSPLGLSFGYRCVFPESNAVE
jgi:hypothetical protein